MPRHQDLIEEVGNLDRLIAAIASEVESERAASAHSGALLREMEDALAELRLARGVRLMLITAYGEATQAGPQRHSVAGPVPFAGWPRVGQRVA